MSQKLQIKPPDDTPGYLYSAWLSALTVALENPAILAAFKAETGMSYSPPKSGLERMVDEATGFQEQFIKVFVEWFNVNVWGPM